jgi:hypothetical protein
LNIITCAWRHQTNTTLVSHRFFTHAAARSTTLSVQASHALPLYQHKIPHLRELTEHIHIPDHMPFLGIVCFRDTGFGRQTRCWSCYQYQSLFAPVAPHGFSAHWPQKPQTLLVSLAFLILTTSQDTSFINFTAPRGLAMAVANGERWVTSL